MRVAGYVRVSTDRQQQAQTIEQQVSLLRAYVSTHPDWVLREKHLFRDDGYSGARLQRPGLDALRDQVARAEFDVIVIAAPDRLAGTSCIRWWYLRNGSVPGSRWCSSIVHPATIRTSSW